MAISKEMVKDIQALTQPDSLAGTISTLFTTWKSSKSGWEAEVKELRNYLFATDTSTTSNATLPWKNKTTMPKLAQLRDNLHANYMSALFPHRDWFKWSPEDKDSATRDQAKAIEAYMRTKLERSGFYDTMSRLVYDYIDTGNVFGEVDYVAQNHTTGDGLGIPVYHGPMLYRVSPFDIVFDPTAPSFESTPKITRTITTLGTLKKEAEAGVNVWAATAFEEASRYRTQFGQYQTADIDEHAGINVDGFGSFYTYLTSGYVEILEFEGDLYDAQKNELLIGHRIIVIDRKTVVYNEPFPSWLGTSSKAHVAWRLRPDNLYGMGPLANLVGMQYRIDHLENLKADVFDQIAHPVIYERGYVEDWNWGPGERIKGDTESEVRVLSPDTTALNADFQIQNMLNLMEEMAGAPKQAMGIRTPGEKTAFEVQSLDNAASRIFQAKIEWFETQFVEPVLNRMLETARRNLEIADVAQVVDDDFGVTEFMKITPDDLKKQGRLVPVGARHFARQNQLAQNLVGFVNSAAYQDPAVQVHVSGIKLAQTFEELLDLDKFDLVQSNIRIAENMETQQAQTSSQELQVGQLQAANAADEEALNG